MKLKNRLVYILAVLITLPLVGTVAQAQTITVLQRFDFHGFGVNPTATVPHKISDQGDLIGTVVDVSGKQQGFIYKYRLGKFSAPFSDPNDTGNDTQGRGTNILRHSVGEYLNGTDGTFHGYLLTHPTFINFDVVGAVDTIPLGINNNGDFVGTCTLPNLAQPAFASLSQHVNTFAVPGATATLAYQINDSNQIIGSYIDASMISHGFTRDSAGNLTFPIDVPGSTETMLFGNNSLNWGVGRYTDASEVTHGLYFITPDQILTFDAPYADSTFTSIDGINKNGQACGSYVDTAGITHGLVLQVITPTPTPTATPTPASTPTPTATAAATATATATPTATATATATATPTSTPTPTPTIRPS
jgi:cell division septation protein DedD